MPKIALFPLIAALCLICQPVAAAEESFGNIRPGVLGAPGFTPGAVIRLPDGRQTIIREYLPNGQLQTDLGIIISPQGVIVEGEGKGESVAVIEAPERHNIVTAPESGAWQAQTATPESGAAQEPPVVAVPGGQAALPSQPATPAPTTVAPGKNGELTIVELLPMTTLPEAKKPEARIKKSEPKPEPPRKEAKKPEPAKKAEVKPEQPPKAKVKQEPPQKAETKPEPEKKQPENFKKPSVGQELRIPPDAHKTGNLDFLEGCWQGTRPEYYSKRTIRECFCFGANGKNGKRRVFDPQGNRMCIGSAKASLSQSGLLSVTSSGAACNDGERWGSAQMSCKNNGPKTPCSWVFPDTRGGHQAYTIPFVRVESCGR